MSTEKQEILQVKSTIALMPSVIYEKLHKSKLPSDL